MTDEVAELVLDDNRVQNALLGVSRGDAADKLQLHAQIVADLVARRALDPVLEGLPDDAGFATLLAAGEGLSGPELAVLLAHIKLDIKTAVLQTDLPDVPEVADRLTSYFPPALTSRHASTLALHPLRREIATTSLVNQMIGRSGLTYAFVLREATEQPLKTHCAPSSSPPRSSTCPTCGPRSTNCPGRPGGAGRRHHPRDPPVSRPVGAVAADPSPSAALPGG